MTIPPDAIVKRIRDLIARATHASTPEEEARTCALIAARLIATHEIELRGKTMPQQPPPPPPPPPAQRPHPPWWPFDGFGSPFGGFGGSPFGGSPFASPPPSYAPPHVPEYDPIYEGMAWSRNPKPCPMCGKPWPRDGRLCPCTRPVDYERAAKWARSWGYSVRPQTPPPAAEPFPDPFAKSAPPTPPPPPPPSARPPKRRSSRKRRGTPPKKDETT